MAATVENRHFSHLKSGLPGMVHSLAHNRPGSPVSGGLSKITVNGNLGADYSSSSDDSDDDENDCELAIKRANAILEPSVLDSRDESTADNWVKRNASMVRLTGKHPFNAEAPLSRLVEIGFITPVPLHYVRNHGPVTKANWDEWTVDVSGLVKQPTRFTMEQLVNDFKSKEFPVTLVCAGNRRKEQNMTKQTIGFNWGAAGVSTTVWRGVSLRSVLKRCGILTKKQGALHVCFEGAEDLPGGGGSKYGTSITREMALDPSRDIILAYMQNGERLAPDHGFPVRMIIPGFIGGRMVKWLKRIFVTTKESDNYYHFRDNRVLPSHVDPELATAEGWWYKPEHIINELNINSAISTPAHDEILSINSRTTQRPYTLKGYAYSGGGKKVTRVEITMNGGETWNVCTLDCPEKPNKYGKYWCWCFWSIEVEVLDILGAKEIAVRAWDQSLNTQPEKLIWNLMGMMNNCWFKVKVHICKTQKGGVGILFEHPTLPGNQNGGWMMKERQVEKAAENQAVKKSVSSPVINTNSKLISLAEVEKHKSADSPWIIVHGNVYDCTRFLKEHPGGTDSILINAGTDCTEEFDAIHSEKAKKMLEEYRIGELSTTGDASAESSPNTSSKMISMTTNSSPNTSPKTISTSANSSPNTSSKTVSTSVNSSPNSSSKMFSMSEVEKHMSADSPWIIVHGKVYDCTRFLKYHPGGTDSILTNAGTDCTEEFDAVHSDKAKKILEKYLIGGLLTSNASADSSPLIKEIASPPARKVALVPREKTPCKLVQKISLSHDVRLFRFALPNEEQLLGLPVGKHIFICANIDEKLYMRAYTPSSAVDTVGYFELLVKIYFKNVHPKFPNGGLMTQHLDSMELGSFIDVKGPLGHIEYTGKGNFSVHGKPKFAKKLAMIAGGSGITPIYQVMQAILKDDEDETEMHVVYANRTEDDILLRDELDEWAEKYPNRVKLWYVVQESIKEGWKYSVGFITENILREHTPEASPFSLALACGPPPMLQFAVNPNLEKMGYDIKESLLVF